MSEVRAHSENENNILSLSVYGWMQDIKKINKLLVGKNKAVGQSYYPWKFSLKLAENIERELFVRERQNKCCRTNYIKKENEEVFKKKTEKKMAM